MLILNLSLDLIVRIPNKSPPRPPHQDPSYVRWPHGLDQGIIKPHFKPPISPIIIRVRVRGYDGRRAENRVVAEGGLCADDVEGFHAAHYWHLDL